jgi:hypothetical protein
MKPRKKKHRNILLAVILKTDPNIVKTRVKKSEKGKGRKNRPRKKKVDLDS